MEEYTNATEPEMICLLAMANGLKSADSTEQQIKSLSNTDDGDVFWVGMVRELLGLSPIVRLSDAIDPHITGIMAARVLILQHLAKKYGLINRTVRFPNRHVTADKRLSAYAHKLSVLKAMQGDGPPVAKALDYLIRRFISTHES